MQQGPGATSVCVVDDDVDVLLSLRFLLETEGFSVRTYRSGQELLDSTPHERIDCLIVDYKMPSMDGLDLVRTLRARDVRAPVVVITGYPSAGVEARAAASGIRHVVLKPHIEENLLAHVSAALREEADENAGLRQGP